MNKNDFKDMFTKEERQFGEFNLNLQEDDGFTLQVLKTQPKKQPPIPTHGREDVGVVAPDGVGLAAVNRLGLKLLGLVVKVRGAVLLLLLLAVAIVPLTDSHHLHPPLLPADDDYGEEESGDGEGVLRNWCCTQFC